MISEVDPTAGLIAMWTLLAVRYHDAVDGYKTLAIPYPPGARVSDRTEARHPRPLIATE